MSKFYAIKVLQKRKPAHYLCIEDGEPLVVASVGFASFYEVLEDALYDAAKFEGDNPQYKTEIAQHTITEVTQ